VNVERPDDNGPVLLYKVQAILGEGEHDNEIYKGYLIMVGPIDIRVVYDEPSAEPFRAQVVGEDQILVTVPSWPHSLVHNRDALLKSGLDDDVMLAMDDARHRVRLFDQSKHILLQFPRGQVLSTKEIAEPGSIVNEDDLSLEVVKVPVNYLVPNSKPPKTLKWNDYFATWKVARLDERALKRGKVETKPTVSSLFEKISALGLDDDDDSNHGMD
jgi:hypothetical protein